MALSVETYEQLQNRIKNLEAKLFLMIEFKNAEEYNHLHQRHEGTVELLIRTQSLACQTNKKPYFSRNFLAH
ncbi:MAG: hypothetical protein ACLRJC_15835 [Emergencia timonensis]|uniref:hypothetical protein n=1 Tax=Emergencia timonensis TaxID=1776384 RepID=UPI000835018B|nr:hypothetical protein [Emergencia timonensis]WNX87876.1 hypothetical protein RVY71_16940 [Emergencia timonensis]